MMREAPAPDWELVAGLLTVTAEAGDLDVVELAQLGLVTPILRLSPSAMASLAGVDTVVVRDEEATPLLLGRRHADALHVETLRRVATHGDKPTDVGPDEHVDLAVIVRAAPDATDLAQVDALTTARGQVVWMVLAGRSREGRRLQATILGLMEGRQQGRHRMIRVPWPAPRSRELFELPVLPTPEALAATYQARHFVVVGETHPDQMRSHRGGAVVFLTGLSGSGKSTLAKAVRDAVESRSDREVTVLDGDDVRRMLSSGLGFDPDGRSANVRRVSWVASLLSRHGGVAITALIAPFAEGRIEARRMAEEVGDFLLVWVSTPIEECERRDRKGLYMQARAGRLANFTGIDSPYEAPDDADLVIDTTQIRVSEAAELVLRELEERALRRGGALGRPRGISDAGAQERDGDEI